MIFLLCALFGATPYHIDPVPHAVATGAMFLVLGIGEGAGKSAMVALPVCRTRPDGLACDPGALNGWDRTVVGNDSRGWRTTSDVLAVGALGLPILADALDAALWDGRSTWPSDTATDSLVLGESVVTALFLTELLKFSVRRPRPLMYQGGIGLVDSELSFPSGHAALTAAATTAYSVTYFLRHDGWTRWLVFGAGLALTSLTAYGRVAGGEHFYTDVLAGMTLGGACGFLIPYALRSDVSVTAVPTRGGGYVAVSF